MVTVRFLVLREMQVEVLCMCTASYLVGGINRALFACEVLYSIVLRGQWSEVEENNQNITYNWQPDLWLERPLNK
jgi:hypothetical protein